MILNNIHTRATLAAGLLAGCVVLLVPGLTKAQAADIATAAPSASTAPAAAAQPRPGYVVFFEQSSTEISPAAADTIRAATSKVRASKASLVRIVGRADYAEAVKAELVRQGVQPTSIVLVGRDDSSPVLRASTGVAEPINRRVLIAF
jgi:outer membrane protein OmpA-like peptidoglycan-associated protein